MNFQVFCKLFGNFLEENLRKIQENPGNFKKITKLFRTFCEIKKKQNFLKITMVFSNSGFDLIFAQKGYNSHSLINRRFRRDRVSLVRVKKSFHCFITFYKHFIKILIKF